jgi:quercetin dioxygenase-like cupin family protein
MIIKPNVTPPIQKTETCKSPPHIQYIISGKIGVSLEDGTEEELGPGDVAISRLVTRPG